MMQIIWTIWTAFGRTYFCSYCVIELLMSVYSGATLHVAIITVIYKPQKHQLLRYTGKLSANINIILYSTWSKQYKLYFKCGGGKEELAIHIRKYSLKIHIYNIKTLYAKRQRKKTTKAAVAQRLLNCTVE